MKYCINLLKPMYEKIKYESKDYYISDVYYIYRDVHGYPIPMYTRVS